MPSLPVVCIFGVKRMELESSPCPPFETNKLDCCCYLTDDDLSGILERRRPVAIVSFGGVPSDFPNLMNSSFSVRRKWLHFETTDDLKKKGDQVFDCFLSDALARRTDTPLISVFTPACNMGDKIMRPFLSLKAQTYQNWEWVVYDDSYDDGKTFAVLTELARTDPRVRVYMGHRQSGVIGEVKRTACDLCRGQFLVELDHDDELVPETLEWVVKGYEKYPEVGFIYTDFAECDEGGAEVKYGPGWGFGYGSYREEEHNGVKYQVVNSPSINAKTIRHIVAAPNHLRSWRSDVYRKIGGHCDTMHVADDYDLMVRTFLETRMGRIPKMAYVQYRNQSGNTHQTRIKEIQRLVRYISIHYDKRIHDRLLELGVSDFVWKEGDKSSFFNLQAPNEETESHCTVMIDVDTPIVSESCK